MARLNGVTVLLGLNLVVTGGLAGWVGWGMFSNGPIYLDEEGDRVDGELSIGGELRCDGCLRASAIANGTITKDDIQPGVVKEPVAFLGGSVMTGLSIDEATKFYHPNGATSRSGEEVPLVIPRNGTLTDLHTHLVTAPQGPTSEGGPNQSDASSDNRLEEGETLTITVRVNRQDTPLETTMTWDGGKEAIPGFRTWHSSATVDVQRGDLITLRARADQSLYGIGYGWTFAFIPET